MKLWDWLQFNSIPLQSISALFATVLTVVTIWVLLITWRAIQRQAVASELQADAARALMRVAEEQTKAAKDAAVAAKRQADLIAIQIDMSMSPLLVAEPDDSNPIRGHRSYRLINRGQGVAFQVHYWEAHMNARDGSRAIHAVQPPTLAPGVSAGIVVPDRLECWTVQYKGIDNQERWLMVYLEPGRGQQHTIRIAGTQKVLDV